MLIFFGAIYLNRVAVGFFLDAVEKILLRPETGKSHAKFAEKLNRKLLREVTSISRMTHKNIVRYYQAWVEGESFVKDSDSESEVISEDPITAEYESSSQSGWWEKKVSGDESDDDKSNVGKIDDFADMLRFGTPNNVLQVRQKLHLMYMSSPSNLTSIRTRSLQVTTD